MSEICTHEFDEPDPDYPEHSKTEFDLAARLNMSLRKNLKTGRYEIFSLQHQDIVFHSYPTLSEAVHSINAMENNGNLVEVKCGFACPALKKKFKEKFKEMAHRS